VLRSDMRAAPWTCLTLLLLLSGTARGQKKPPGWVEVDRIVAVVNQDVILASEVARRVAPLSPGPGKPPPAGAERQVLEQMIDEALLTQEAVRARIEVPNADVEGAIQQIKQQNQLDDAGLLKALAAQGYTLELYREDLRQQILRLRAINQIIRPRVVVRDDELLAAYNEAKKKAKSVKLGTFEAEKERMRQNLIEQRMATETVKWLQARRVSSYIAVRGS
jgi:parvulin-like peptidyl-prolyl isomerase